MELYPEDLGPELAGAIEQRRAEQLRAALPWPLPGTLGAWAVFTFLSAVLLNAAAVTPLGFLMGIVTAFLLGWFALQFQEVRAIKRRTGPRPLTAQEVGAQQQFSSGPLVQSYLSLAVSVAEAAPAEAEAAREVRTAIRALGTTVFALPDEDAPGVADDPLALRAEAARLLGEADAETDAVIGASLRRRAESLTRRADTAARTLLLLRRNGALRQETGEQIDALRTSLTAFRVSGRQSVPELADLAVSIQRVAQEANAIMQARAEVEGLVAHPRRGSLAPASGGARVGIGQGPS